MRDTTDRDDDTGEAAFWRFWAAREAARLRKEAGGPPPHSDDPVIAEWRFCNCYRDLDRGTTWFAPRRGDSEPGDALRMVLWRAVVYRLLNRRETFEAAEADGVFTWREPLDLEAWLSWLTARARAGETLFTGRHIVRGLGSYAVSTRWLKENLGKVAGDIRLGERERGLRYVCATLRSVPGVGPFFAWQVARDLVEAGVVAEDGGWALAGPGARYGAALAAPGARPAGSALALSEREALRTMLALRDRQDKAAAELGLDRSRWHRVPATLADIEHALCEFARYEDLRTGAAARAKCGRYYERVAEAKGAR
jgi:hypothetical protein